MRKRSLCRQKAMQALYEAEIRQEGALVILKDLWNRKLEGELWMDAQEAAPEPQQEFDASMRQYTEQLVRGVLNRKVELDEAISKHAMHWTLDRIGILEKNIMRLAVYEGFHEADVPPKVAINEAVELAKNFSDNDSAKFVNGVLDKIFRPLTSSLTHIAETTPSTSPKQTTASNINAKRRNGMAKKKASKKKVTKKKAVKKKVASKKKKR